MPSKQFAPSASDYEDGTTPQVAAAAPTSPTPQTTPQSQAAPQVPLSFNISSGPKTFTPDPSDFEPDAPKKPQFTPNPSTLDWQSIFGHVLPIAGPIVGSMLAGPPGGVAGAVFGGLAGKTLEENRPLSPSEALLEGTKSGTIQAAVPEVGSAAFEYGSKLPISQKLLSLITKSKGPVPEDVQKAIELGLTEKNLSAKASEIGTELSGSPYAASSSAYGASGQTAVRTKMGQATAAERNFFNQFRAHHVEDNTEFYNKLDGYKQSSILGPNGKPQVIPVVSQVAIKGPILTANSTKFASELLPELDGYMNGESFQTLDPYSQGRLRRAYNAVKELADGLKTLGPDGKEAVLPIKEWDSLKQIKTDINRTVGGDVFPTRGPGILKQLAQSIDQDIDNSVQHLWKNGDTAITDLNKANAATEFKKRVFNKEVLGKVFGKSEGGGKLDFRNEADPSDFFNQAYQSPEKAQRLIQAMGPENSRLMKGDYWDNYLMPKANKVAKGTFNPDPIIKELSDPNSASRAIFNSDERNGMLQFLRAAQTVGPDVAEQSKFGALFKGGYTVFRFGKGVTKLAMGNLPGGINDVRIAVKNLDLMGNPKASSTAARLLKIPADSVEGESRMKLILKALAGASVNVTLGDRGQSTGTIGKDGKIELD